MKKNWLKNISDEELSRLLKKDYAVKELPYFFDNKILGIIRDKKKIEAERKNIFRSKLLKTALGFSFSFVIIFLSGVLFSLFSEKNTCIAVNVTGNSYQKTMTGRYKTIVKNMKIYKNREIKTKDASQLDIRIGEKSFTIITDSSLLSINELEKKKEKESTGIFLKKGFAYFDVKLPGESSTFVVESDILSVSVKGTKFNVRVSADGTTRVEAFEGNVVVKIKNQLSGIIFKKLVKKFNLDIKIPSIVLNKGDFFELNYDDFKKYNTAYGLIKSSLNNDLKSGKSFNEMKSIVEDKINEIIKLLNDLLDKKNNREKKSEKKNKIIFTAEKLPFSAGIILPEKQSAIKSAGNNFLITSAADKSIYCVSSENRKVLWKINNPGINSIISPAVFFKNEILLSTPDKISVFYNKGYDFPNWGHTSANIDNIKIWNEVLPDPSFEYNSGSGREDALHPIYGASNNYKPSNDIKVGYYYGN